MDSPLLTIAQVARHCRVSPRTVTRWIKTRRLRARKIGRIVRIDPQDLKRFLMAS